MISRDGTHISLWKDNEKETFQSQYSWDEKADSIIVGAGITGITTALLLQKSGKKCIILEAQNIGYGTTGGTTAHLNTLLDTPYSTIIKNFGEENARLVARAAEDALIHIHQNINQYQIDCGYEKCKAYLFARQESQNKELQEILDACKTVDLPVIEEDSVPVPIEFTQSFSVEGQGKFHPMRYIQALLQEFVKLGGVIIENIRVTGLSEVNQEVHVETVQKTFICDHLIYATHVPPGINLIHLRYTAYRSYAIAVTLTDKQYPEDLSYDMYDPYHYYRTQEIDGIQYLIAGGEDHKTGDKINTEAPFVKLEAHVRKYFKVEEVTHRWSSQYYETTDGLPYIGILPGNSDRILVATGFGGNGMTFGTLSALILKSILLKEEDSLIKLFSPSRLKPIAGFKNFVAHNADVLKEVMGKFFSSNPSKGFADLARTEGKIMDFDDWKIGVYKDENGAIHAVQADCTHMGCTVAWNQTEKSWDCPCHGARFSVDGTVLNGPSDRDLEYINVELLTGKE